MKLMAAYLFDGGAGSDLIVSDGATNANKANTPPAGTNFEITT